MTTRYLSWISHSRPQATVIPAKTSSGYQFKGTKAGLRANPDYSVEVLEKGKAIRQNAVIARKTIFLDQIL